MIRTLFKYRSRISWMTLKDFLRYRREIKKKGFSKIPLLYMSEQDIRDPEHIFKDQPTFAEVFELDKKL